MEYFMARAGERGYQTLINETFGGRRSAKPWKRYYGGSFGTHRATRSGSAWCLIAEHEASLRFCVAPPCEAAASRNDCTSSNKPGSPVPVKCPQYFAAATKILGPEAGCRLVPIFLWCSRVRESSLQTLGARRSAPGTACGIVQRS
jgi:hypothetical protein